MPTDPIGEIPILITADSSTLQADFDKAESLAKQAAEDIAASFTAGVSNFNMSQLADDFAKSMNGAGEVVDTLGEKFKEFGESASEWIEHPIASFRSLIESIGPVGIAIAVVTAALAELTHVITDLVLEEGAAAQATQNLADKLNLSFEDTKQLGEMAQVVGINIDVLARTSMRLADALDNSSTSGKKIVDALQAMGIYSQDSGEALKQLLEKLAEIPDATERIAKAHEIMGRSAVQLEPLLSDYDALKEKVIELGGVLDSEGVAKLIAANQAANLLAISWEHLKEALAATFAPAVTAGIDLLTHFLTSTPDDSLEKQIANLTSEINEMSAAAKAGTPNVAGFFAAASGLVGPDDSPGLLADKQAALDALKAQQESIKTENDYLAARDKAAAIRKQQDAEQKAEMDAMVAAETAFHNSVVDLYNTFPDTYQQYTDKLAEGGKTAAESLKQVQGELDKATSLSSQLTGKPLADLNEWIAALTKMRDTAKDFAANDAFYKLAQQIDALTQKFPDQVKEISAANPLLAQYFSTMVKGAEQVPDALKKIDTAQLTQKFLEGQKKLDDAIIKTGQDMDKAWMAWEKGAEKASSKETVVDAVNEWNQLPVAIQNAIKAQEKLTEANKFFGITADDSGQIVTRAFAEMEIELNSSKTTLDGFQIVWSKMSTILSKLAQTDVPLAIKGYQELIDKAVQLGATTGQVLQMQAAEMQAVINAAEQVGASATGAIENLENIRLKQEQLKIQTETIGNVYKGLMKSFMDVFDNLDKGLTKAIVDGGSLGDVFKGLLKSFETDVVGTFVHGFTEGLKNAFLQTGVGQAISGFLTTIFQKVFGGLFDLGVKAATTAPQLAATSANTTALATNTAALGALTSAMSAQGAASSAANAAGGGGAGGGISGLASGVTAISTAVTAITSVLQFLQGRRMEQDIGRIEVTTRGMLNQLISIQGTMNDYLPGINHLVDVWAEIQVTNDILRLMGQSGGGLGTGTDNGADPDFAQKIADAINGNPSNEGAGGNTFADISTQLQASADGAAALGEGLQTTASSAYTLDQAVSNTTDSLSALNDATQQVNGALPGFTDGMSKAVFDSMTHAQNEAGQNLSPDGPRMNATPIIQSVPVPDALTGPGGFMQGSMMPTGIVPNQYENIAPVVTGPGVTRGGPQATVSVYAVDPSGRQIASATIQGLEEVGIRTR